MKDNERDIWNDVARGDRFSNLDGDSCAYKKADGTIVDGVMKNGVCSLPKKETNVWDTITHIADAANNIFGKNQADTTSTTTYPTNNTPQSGGISALGVVGIILGLGVVGFVIYKVASKK